jgi:hypothetical protein
VSLASPLVPLPPIPLVLVPRLLRRRGAVASLDRLREAAEAGFVRAARDGGGSTGRWRVDEGDLDEIAALGR